MFGYGSSPISTNGPFISLEESVFVCFERHQWLITILPHQVLAHGQDSISNYSPKLKKQLTMTLYQPIRNGFQLTTPDLQVAFRWRSIIVSVRPFQTISTHKSSIFENRTYYVSIGSIGYILGSKFQKMATKVVISSSAQVRNII